MNELKDMIGKAVKQKIKSNAKISATTAEKNKFEKKYQSLEDFNMSREKYNQEQLSTNSWNKLHRKNNEELSKKQQLVKEELDKKAALTDFYTQAGKRLPYHWENGQLHYKDRPVDIQKLGTSFDEQGYLTNSAGERHIIDGRSIHKNEISQEDVEAIKTKSSDSSREQTIADANELEQALYNKNYSVLQKHDLPWTSKLFMKALKEIGGAEQVKYVKDRIKDKDSKAEVSATDQLDWANLMSQKYLPWTPLAVKYVVENKPLGVYKMFELQGDKLQVTGNVIEKILKNELYSVKTMGWDNLSRFWNAVLVNYRNIEKIDLSLLEDFMITIINTTKDMKKLRTLLEWVTKTNIENNNDVIKFYAGLDKDFDGSKNSVEIAHFVNQRIDFDIDFVKKIMRNLDRQKRQWILRRMENPGSDVVEYMVDKGMWPEINILAMVNDSTVFNQQIADKIFEKIKTEKIENELKTGTLKQILKFLPGDDERKIDVMKEMETDIVMVPEVISKINKNIIPVLDRLIETQDQLLAKKFNQRVIDFSDKIEASHQLLEKYVEFLDANELIRDNNFGILLRVFSQQGYQYIDSILNLYQKYDSLDHAKDWLQRQAFDYSKTNINSQQFAEILSKYFDYGTVFKIIQETLERQRIGIGDFEYESFVKNGMIGIFEKGADFSKFISQKEDYLDIIEKNENNAPQILGTKKFLEDLRLNRENNSWKEFAFSILEKSLKNEIISTLDANSIGILLGHILVKMQDYYFEKLFNAIDNAEFSKKNEWLNILLQNMYFFPDVVSQEIFDKIVNNKSLIDLMFDSNETFIHEGYAEYEVTKPTFIKLLKIIAEHDNPNVPSSFIKKYSDEFGIDPTKYSREANTHTVKSQWLLNYNKSFTTSSDNPKKGKIEVAPGKLVKPFNIIDVDEYKDGDETKKIRTKDWESGGEGLQKGEFFEEDVAKFINTIPKNIRDNQLKDYFYTKLVTNKKGNPVHKKIVNLKGIDERAKRLGRSSFDVIKRKGEYRGNSVTGRAEMVDFQFTPQIIKRIMEFAKDPNKEVEEAKREYLESVINNPKHGSKKGNYGHIRYATDAVYTDNKGNKHSAWFVEEIQSDFLITLLDSSRLSYNAEVAVKIRKMVNEIFESYPAYFMKYIFKKAQENGVEYIILTAETPANLNKFSKKNGKFEDDYNDNKKLIVSSSSYEDYLKSAKKNYINPVSAEQYKTAMDAIAAARENGVEENLEDQFEIDGTLTKRKYGTTFKRIYKDFARDAGFKEINLPLSDLGIEGQYLDSGNQLPPRKIIDASVAKVDSNLWKRLTMLHESYEYKI